MPLSWYAAWPVRSRLDARRGRHGRGLPRTRHEARSRRRDQDPARQLRALTPNALARFAREAQILASLNHPHIAQIYGLERAGGHAVARAGAGRGRDAGRRASRKGRCRSTRRCRSPADRGGARSGARAGHHPPRSEAGEHQVRPDGTVKVLDFGLAKRSSPDRLERGRDLTNSPTLTSPALMTGVGVILGTAAYMSPGTGEGPRRGQAQRRVGVRMRAVRDAHRQAAIRGR